MKIIMTNGYDNVMMPFFACAFATSAVVLAIFFRTRNRQLKEMALPNFISGIFGVTEPAIYGIFYEQLFKECRKYNIRPLVTISHFDCPIHLIEKYGGWRNHRIVF